LPAGLVVFSELVLLWFSLDHVEEKTGEIPVALFRVAEDFAHVELEVTAEAGTQFAVTGEAELVAGLAEMEIAHRADESDDLTAAGNLEVAGGTVGAYVGARSEASEPEFDEFFRLARGEEIVFG